MFGVGVREEIVVALVNAVLLALWGVLPALLLAYIRQSAAVGRLRPEFSLRQSEAEELDRAPAGGNGGGIEYLYSRRRFALAPNGLSYIGAANPTNATLALAASWDRKVARKNVGLAAVKVNIL